MENSSTFWNKIAELLGTLGLPYISPLEAIMIIVLAFLVLLFILWLVFRKARLWYWKTNIQIDTLKSIDGRLHSVEEKLSVGVPGTVGDTETTVQDQDSTEAPEGDPQQKNEPEDTGLTAVGRSGRIYTEAELELQIKE